MKFRNILWLALALISLNLSSQELTKKKKSGIYYQEIYFINKKDKKKNGAYLMQRVSNNDTLIHGNYVNDVKMGTWSYYSEANQLFFKYNHDSNQLVLKSDKINRMDSFIVWIDDNFVLQKVESPTLFLGFEKEFKIILASNVVIPFSMVDKGMSGMSVFTMDISEEGQLLNLDIEQSLDKAFENQIIKEIKFYQAKWVPAIFNGKAVKSRIYVVASIIPEIPEVRKDENSIPDKPYIFKVSFNYWKGTSVTTRPVQNTNPSRISIPRR